jgi:hypothetical protein
MEIADLLVNLHRIPNPYIISLNSFLARFHNFSPMFDARISTGRGAYISNKPCTNDFLCQLSKEKIAISNAPFILERIYGPSGSALPDNRP